MDQTRVSDDGEALGSSRASVSKQDRGELALRGDWTAAKLPSLKSAVDDAAAAGAAVIDLSEVTHWDSRLPAALLTLQREIESRGQRVTLNAADAGLQQLLDLARAVAPLRNSGSAARKRLSRHELRKALGTVGHNFITSLAFLGATLQALGRTLLGRGKMRRRELIDSCGKAGPGALGIIALTSVLVGMILAYLGAAQLQQFGAAVYVADLVAIGMLREMGALMTAVVMAGRTGAAYAAELSTMQANEEIDAIRTLGIDPLEFLVVPRVIALFLMMPLLVIFADALGILGGALVAGGMGVTPLQYISQLETAVALNHFLVGIAKSLIFATLIALAGCQAGMSAGRNSAAVGKATTDAVVTAVVYLIIADAAINILCQQLAL